MNKPIRLHRHLRALLWIGAALAAFGAAANPEAVSARAGIIKSVEGQVTVGRGDASLPAQVGMPVYQADRVLTGPDGRTGITFEDNTLLSLGPSGKLSIDRFVFDTTTHDGDFDISLDKG